LITAPDLPDPTQRKAVASDTLQHALALRARKVRQMWRFSSRVERLPDALWSNRLAFESGRDLAPRHAIEGARMMVTESFVRRERMRYYRRLLRTPVNERHRSIILELLDETRQEQIAAGDPLEAEDRAPQSWLR
jgi:hypothetical protein